MLTILVVDDDEIVGRVLSRVLIRQGHTVWLAASVAQALLLAETYHPRLALLDLCLPDGDGVDLARRLRQLIPDMAMIFMSAYPVRHRENPELAQGFLRILIKP